MDSALIAEFDATVKLIKELRKDLKKEGWTVPGQRGAQAKNPKADVLKEQQANLRGLGRLLTARKQGVPIPDDELSELLD